MQTKITIGKQEFIVGCSPEDIIRCKPIGFIKTTVGTYKMVSDGNGAYETLTPKLFWSEKWINTDLINFIESESTRNNQ